MSWEVAKTKPRVNDSLRKRAEQRIDDVEGGDGTWVVWGSKALNDTLDRYKVDGDVGGDLHCTCQDNDYGQYRPVCSHREAVRLYEEGREGDRAGDSVYTPSKTAQDGVGSVSPARTLGLIKDPEHSSWGTPPLPSWIDSFRPHQEKAVERVVRAYEQGASYVFLDAPTGCLTGDTEIGVNRAGKSFRITIKDLVHKFNGGVSMKGRGRATAVTWDPDIPTKVRRGLEDRGIVRLGVLKGAYESGIKDVYRLCTNKRSIKATSDHEFLTLEGYVPLGKLEMGDEVVVDVGQGLDKDEYHKPYYRQEQALFHHPYASRRNLDPGQGRGYSVAVHRLVAETELNMLEYDEYLERLRGGDTEDLRFLDPEEWAVHHIDRDSLNNDPSNLKILTHDEHRQIHAEDTMDNVAYQLGAEEIVSIEYVGREETYDLEMTDEPHNFLANGIVVHNSGKTLIAELVRRRMRAMTAYTCSTLTLQSQFLSDYPYSKVVRGRSNYQSPVIDWGKGSCADCRCSPNDHCSTPDLCNHRADPCPDDVCPYRDAKWEARRNPLAVINTAYALAEMNYVGGMSGRELMIVDECDLLENALMSFVEVRIPQDLANELGIDPPAKKTVEESWAQWAPRAYYLVEGGIAKTEATIKSTYDPEIRSKLQRKAERLEGLRDNLARLKDDLGDEERTDWVYSPEEWKGRTTIIFKPVTVDRLAGGVLWNKADKFLLMSASIISPQEMVESLGIPDDEWDVVYVPSTFPVENRQVKVAPVANVVNKNYDVAVPRLVRGIQGVMNLHPRERTLIHTVSYRLAKDLFRNITSEPPHPRDGLWTARKGSRLLITYTRGSSRDDALNLYKNTAGSVLLAPSLDRGTDLPGELCRCQIIAKVPFPYLGDKQVSARLYGTRNGQAWYSVNTIRSIVQMTGRGVRSRDDHAVTYILDENFSKLFRKHGRLFPSWWREALDWSGETKREVIEAA